MLRHGAELKKQIEIEITNETSIEEERKRQNRLKEYERKIMEKSDKLKEKALQEQLINIHNHKKQMDLVLNDCDKIATYKKKFSD